MLKLFLFLFGANIIIVLFYTFPFSIKQNKLPISQPLPLFEYPDNTYMIVEGAPGNLNVYYTLLGIKEEWPTLDDDIYYFYTDK